MNIRLDPTELAKTKINLLVEILASQKAQTTVLFQLLSKDDEHLDEILKVYESNRKDESSLIRAHLISEYGDLSELF
jgi:hypothetical protein